MALTQKLLIRQSQALVMTPQLMQAIKLLQLSNLDLATYVEGELERNPLLERTNDEEGGPSEAENEVAGVPDVEAPPSDWLGEALETDRTAIENKFDASLENVFPDDSAGRPARAESEPPAYSEWAGVGSGGREDNDYNLEAFVSAEVTLSDHLAAQIVKTKRVVLVAAPAVLDDEPFAVDGPAFDHRRVPQHSP